MNNNVITKIGQKQQDGSVIYLPVGSDLRYIGANQNSHVNNLEEQLIIGTDCTNNYTEELITPDDGSEPYIERLETLAIKKEETTNNYYVLERTIHKEPNTTYDSTTKKVTINLNPKVIESTETLKFFKDGTLLKDITKEGFYTYNNNLKKTTVVEAVSSDT